MQQLIERLKTEGFLPLAEAAREFEVSPDSIARWHTQGARTPSGEIARLEAVRMPGKLLTSRPAIARFLERIGGVVTAK
ncbi:hypothetical protein PX52LOC_05651 [Limnoglobus roseus]|uniref:Uncharacterized protein n=1 Tax=Limnoglobus roseus TaxID=2598579 RepID=A0A5C1AP28_9BACT|nr:hypothetical protein PX52LOC_05651 [Limnoglobus roseus]